jgi:hypothetical protein
MITASEITEPLTVAEATNLAQYEQQIADGMAGFLVTGAAMLAIREGRLYRSTHRSFAAYLEERWPQIGTRSNADRLINAAVVSENLTPVGVKLTSERQARELAQLEPDAQRVAFQQAKELAGGKSPTAAQIRTVVRIAQWEQAAPQAAPVKKFTASKAVLLQHAEALLAGLIDKSTAEERRLLHALFNVGSSVHDDFVTDELWQFGKKRIGQGMDVEWIETGVRHTNE